MPAAHLRYHLRMADHSEKAAGQPERFEDLTPREIVARLSEYIVGQHQAKRAVAVAIRNRLRRLRVTGELRDEIIPKNLILIGPTGVGKTEIARRMALLLRAPFIKVEATKFTEVGYVGRDVDSIVRDLTEYAVRMVRQEKMEQLEATLLGKVVDRLVEYMQPMPSRPRKKFSGNESEEELQQQRSEDERFEQLKRIREKLRVRIRRGEADDEAVTIEAAESSPRLMQVFTSQGMEEMGMDLQNMLEGMTDRPKKKKKVTVGEAKRLLLQEEADKAIDMDSVVREAIERVELAGIVFIDEMDKIAHREGGAHGPDVSREGVQRDILPLVEGTTVITKYGPVRTQHVLFVAAGAFHVSRVSDLIPELQGRFPLRVELEALSEQDFGRILREPKNSLIRQYSALLATEGVKLEFKDGAIDEMARIATQANSAAQNIGARRLHTVLEKLLEDISFDAPYEAAGAAATVTEQVDTTGSGGSDGAIALPAGSAAGSVSVAGGSEKLIVIDREFVREKLAELLKDKDVAQYIL
jgi:ATP-dependent HslUV protease ATP-binding subunit HslU